jgi:signal transduction histidine kinase/ligand-binding sensor domain-containing protein
MRFLFFRSFLFLFFYIQIQTGIAQSFNPYYNFKQLNVENGLAQNIVYHFLQDSRGYMWLGTRNGITVYDGIRTTNFQHDEQNKKSISGNFITRILEDSNHSIWIGNNAGIDLFNAKDNSFTHFGIAMSDGLREDTYCVLLGFSNVYDLWLIDTKSKAIKIFNTKTKSFRTVASTDMVDGMLYKNPVSGYVHIWSYLSIGTTHLAFQKDSLITQEQFFSTDKNNGESPLLIYHVFYQTDSIAWLSTAKGLIELNPVSHDYKIYTNKGKERIIEARYAMLSRKGMLWVSTGYGVYTFDIKTKKFIDQFRNDPLDPFSICSNNIVSLYFDKVGNIWCGSYGNGVSYANVENNFFSKWLSKNEIDHWKKNNNVFWIGLDQQEYLWCILQDVRGFWLLDTSLKVKEYRVPHLENGKPFDGSVYQLFFDERNSAWCMTDRGLFRYYISTNRMKQVGYPLISEKLFGSNWSKMMIRLHDGSLLFSTLGGLYRITTQNGRQLIRPYSELNNRPFISFDIIFEDKENDIYVKDIADNLYVLGTSNGVDHPILKKSLIFREDVIQFVEDSANIYMATTSGLTLLHKNNLLVERSFINKFIPFSSVNNLLAEKNKLWIFSEKGLYYFNTGERTGRLFTVEDGLPSNMFSEFAMVFTSSGKCIAGTNNGLLSFYPEKLKDIIYPPRAQLINIYVNDSSTSFVANPQEASKVELQYYQNTFSFDFSCIGFQHVEADTYEYKLDRYDENWIRSGTTHYTRYSKIPPGKYRFQLHILDARGEISPYIKTLDIEIKKAFWQTTLFKFIMAAFFALLIWLMIKWYLTTRIRQHQREFEKQQAIEKERTRIATDMHDDLGAGLTRIKFLSEIIGLKKQLQQPVEEDISSIGSYANEMIGKMGEIVWALNEKNDSLSDLLSYTRAYTSDYLLTNGLACQVHAPDVFPSVFLSGEFRRNIYLAIKEVLHNIVKHARANKVILTIAIDTNLTITIQDDGVGFDIGNIRPFSNGLNNMHKRMKVIAGSLEIIQKKGTIIILSAPLPE